MVLLKKIDLLRPIVENKTWEYCILWNFTDDNDPSRFIEFVGCCCSCTQGVCVNVKQENDEIEKCFCRDTFVKHSVRSVSCEKLATIPSYLPLYPGVHGEVAMSQKPFWLSNETVGTQLIVPVEGGLIELFRSQHVPADQRMIETLIEHLNIIVNHGFDEDDTKISMSLYLYDHVSPKLELTFPVLQPDIHSNTQELSSGKTSRDGKEIMTIKHKKVKEQGNSKNLVSERNRRKRIKDGLYTLRSLVPNISKMDRASIVADATEYIKELQKTVEELQDELKQLEEQDCKVNDGEVEVCKPKRNYENAIHTPSKLRCQVSKAADKMQVEVHQIGARKFLLKLICTQKPNGFLRVMETVNSLELQVIDVNMTTCDGRVLYILNVEAKGKEIVAKSLEKSLLTIWSSRT